MLDLDQRRSHDGGVQRQEVIVAGGAAVAHLDTRQDEQKTLVFQIAVGDSLRAQQLGPALLEVHQVVRVVQETHAIRLGVADANGDLAAEHRTSRRLAATRSLRSGARGLPALRSADSASRLNNYRIGP